MKSSASQNYSYALDSEGNLLNVHSAKRGALYFCPQCHALMVPHMGNLRRWHFTHKANIEDCCHESYLHKIAKIKIKEAFLNASTFIISYDVPTVCSERNSCKINQGEKCICSERIEHDIKQFYDKCEEEVPYKSFIADLILSSSIKPDREPILIEIYVTHKSTAKKITDGARIIEVQIRNEDDIEEIVTSLKIAGDQYSDRYYLRNEKPKNIFFNFKGELSKHPSYFNDMIPNFIYYMWILDTGYFRFDKCRCNDDPMKYIPNHAHYIIGTEPINWDWAFLEFIKRGVNIKNCIICKYSAVTSFSFNDVRICTLYKKFGTPRNPPITTANTCQYFRRIKDTNQNAVHTSAGIIEKNNSEKSFTIVVRKQQ